MEISTLLVSYTILATVLVTCRELSIFHITSQVDLSILLQNSSHSVKDVPLASQCLRLCDTDSTCTSVVYDEPEKQCHMFTQFQSSHVLLPNVSSSLTYYEKDLGCRWAAADDQDCCFPDITITECITRGIISLYTDCQEAFDRGERKSGDVYYLKPTSSVRIYKAVCQFDSTSGWTVIQRRLDGSVDFWRYWDDYVKGFGSLVGEYWIGLDAIHDLTQANRKLSIYLEAHNGETRTANYTSFYLDGADTEYVIHVSGYSGDAGDSLSGIDLDLNNMPFTTRDNDNDHRDDVNCAVKFYGAWWYVGCHRSNLNGLWFEGGDYSGVRNESEATGTSWYTWKGHYYSYKTIYMRLGRDP